MEHSRADVGLTSLDEFVDVVASIYSPHDRYRSIWDVWCHTLHHAAGVAEQIRREINDERLYREIADFSLWLFTAVLKLKGKFGQSKDTSEAPLESLVRIQNTCSELLWHRYPKLCPHCSGRKIATGNADDASLGAVGPCECLPRQPKIGDEEARRKRLTAVRNHSEKISGEKPASIDEWQKMFGTIFAKSLTVLSLPDIALHLMEELGETSDAMIRMYSYKETNFRLGEPNWRQLNLEAQLADVFSWLFALVEKLEQERGDREEQRSTESIRLSKIIWDHYGSDDLHTFYCATCKNTLCTCSIILVPNTRPIEDLLSKFQ